LDASDDLLQDKAQLRFMDMNQPVDIPVATRSEKQGIKKILGGIGRIDLLEILVLQWMVPCSPWGMASIGVHLQS
jgi:hypothetical protein